jgi:hypothetical protein
MKPIRYILACCFLVLAGCTVTTDHHYYSQAPVQTPQPTNTGDIFNPLTPAELDHVKAEIPHLQPYMTLNDCITALGIPKRPVPTSVWGPPESQSISMQLRADDILLLVRDNRGYVISAQLGDKKWEWPNFHKTP